MVRTHEQVTAITQKTIKAEVLERGRSQAAAITESAQASSQDLAALASAQFSGGANVHNEPYLIGSSYCFNRS